MWIRRLATAACGLGLACASDPVPVVPTASDFTSDASGAGTRDSGRPGIEREGIDLTVTVEGDLPGLAVNLHTVVLGADSDAPFEVADGIREGARFSIAVDAPIDRWMVALDSESSGFLALPFAYIDDDENGVHTPEEQYVGMGLEGAMYIDGSPGTDLAARGFGAGWNAVRVELESGTVAVHPDGASALVLSPQLVPQDRFVMEVVSALVVEGQRVALVPGTVLSGEVSGPIVFDQLLTETVEIAVDGPAPDEHLQDQGADGTQYRDWRYSVESVIVYDDDNESGGFDLTDTSLGTLCAMEAEARLQHTSEPDKAFEALHLATNHIIPAWSLYVEQPDGGRYMRIDEVGPISLAESCGP